MASVTVIVAPMLSRSHLTAITEILLQSQLGLVKRPVAYPFPPHTSYLNFSLIALNCELVFSIRTCLSIYFASLIWYVLQIPSLITFVYALELIL